MTTVIAEILERARKLPRDEQAELAGEIVALLDDGDDDPAVVEREWAAELTRRAERAMSGESTGRPWSEVRERLVARLRGR